MVNNRTPKLFKKETYVKMINLCEVALIDKSDNLDLLYTKRKSERVLEELDNDLSNNIAKQEVINKAGELKSVIKYISVFLSDVLENNIDINDEKEKEYFDLLYKICSKELKEFKEII